MGKHSSKQCVVFQELFDRKTEICFNQERTTSDGGSVLLAAVEARMGLLARLAEVIRPRRVAGRVVHAIETMVRQRVFAIACGYADCNDAGKLASDPVFRILAKGAAGGGDLASQATLSRFENSVSSRDLVRMSYALVDGVLGAFGREYRRKTKWVNLDLDPTVDPTHGAQQMSFFNAFHDTHCYKPTTAFLQVQGDPEQYALGALLRPGNAPDKAAACALLRRLIPRIQRAFPRARIRVRLDGGFACEEVLTELEQWGFVEYAVNLPKNKVLLKKGEKFMRRVRRRFRKSGNAERDYAEFKHQARKWSTKRRVILKAEVVVYPGRDVRDNPRFLVTNMRGRPKSIYRNFYCGRGDTENRIKELKESMALDRTSCHRFLANQFRVLLSVAAFALLQQIRRKAQRTGCARAQAHRLVDHLFKLGARVTVSVRRIVIELPSTSPAKNDWHRIARSLGAA